MRKEDKGNIIAQLGEILKEYPHFYLVDATGMDAAKTSVMRRKCFQSEIKMVLVKNTLLHKAFEGAELDYSPLYGCLKGTTAILPWPPAAPHTPLPCTVKASAEQTLSATVALWASSRDPSQ